MLTLFWGVLASRIFGLARDALIFTYLGVSEWSSAFVLAFTLPNLFRRLLGEGALTSALIPVFSGVFVANGKEAAFSVLNKVIARFLGIICVVTGIVVVALLAVKYIPGLPERWYLGAELAEILMPYMGMICLAAVVSALLNILDHFGSLGLSAVWLNVSMIASLYVGGKWFQHDPKRQVECLCVGVLVGGVLQLWIPAHQLWKRGWKWHFDGGRCEEMSHVVRLFLPGVLGAAVFQINLLCGRLIAFSMDATATSVLYLVNRFMELPLGLFVFAITTVVFPTLAVAIAKCSWGAVADHYRRGLLLVLGLTIPAGVGMAVLRNPIISLFFEWGKFGAQDVNACSPLFLIFAWALPFYAQTTFVTRGFHAMKDTVTPVKIAFKVFALNIFLSLAMYRLGVVGLSLANVFSTIFHGICLQRAISRRNEAFHFTGLWRPIGRMILAAILMGVVCQGILAIMQVEEAPSKWLLVRSLMSVIACGSVVYGLSLYLLQAPGKRKLLWAGIREIFIKKV